MPPTSSSFDRENTSVTAQAAHSGPIPDVLLDPARLERMAQDFARTRDPRLRDSLILSHQRLVRSLAARFLGKGEALDDLVQVGTIGLINALDRYDPEQGAQFSTYATPTILGEIKRHFRDKTSAMRVPRWLQELNQASQRAALQMTDEMGRSPTLSEIAARLGATEEEIAEAMESGAAMNPLSLETHQVSNDGDSSPIADMVGQIDSALHEFEIYHDLWEAMECLERREREIITLRFFYDMNQRMIAERLGLSQMHVSRLQKRGLQRLRDLLSDERRLRLVRQLTQARTKSGRKSG